MGLQTVRAGLRVLRILLVCQKLRESRLRNGRTGNGTLGLFTFSQVFGTIGILYVLVGNVANGLNPVSTRFPAAWSKRVSPKLCTNGCRVVRIRLHTLGRISLSEVFESFGKRAFSIRHGTSGRISVGVGFLTTRLICVLEKFCSHGISIVCT